MGKGILDTLFPLQCLNCGKFLDIDPDIKKPNFYDIDSYSFSISQYYNSIFGSFFCNKCIEPSLIPLNESFCTKCDRLLKVLNHEDYKNLLCPTCINPNPSQRIPKVTAVGKYQGSLRKAIHLLKYNDKTALSRPLGSLLFMAFKEKLALDNIDLIIPVPLHRAKLLKRSFNQSFLLIKYFKKFWMQWKKTEPQWKVDYNLVIRSKNTKSQTGFDKNERLNNIQGAFKVKYPDKVKNKSLLIVDDVYTTGATSREISQALFDAGAFSVDVLVLAKTS